ncbi:MAG: hypothetical protein Q8Q47_05085 [Ignavibacteriaceae bacterium]|nr:hypothetical protein [Ignavibacteriaceae bacterium]
MSPLIELEGKDKLYKYTPAIIQNNGYNLIAINGMINIVPMGLWIVLCRQAENLLEIGYALL